MDRGEDGGDSGVCADLHDYVICRARVGTDCPPGRFGPAILWASALAESEGREMSSKDPGAPGFKQKAVREFKEFLWIAGYLAFFFCALSTYTTLLLRKYEVDDNYLNYGFAIISALVIGKVILIAQMAHLGRGYEARPLYQTVILKSLIFGVVVFAFHFVEEFVKRVIHHKPFGSVWQETRWDDLVARTIVVLCAFIPLFGFMELRRVLGEEKLYSLLRSPGAAAESTSVVSGKAT
jgi:hypothetical protein